RVQTHLAMSVRGWTFVWRGRDVPGTGPLHVDTSDRQADPCLCRSALGGRRTLMSRLFAGVASGLACLGLGAAGLGTPVCLRIVRAMMSDRIRAAMSSPA